MGEISVFAVDVGALRNIGWWRDMPGGERSGRDLDGLAGAVAADLDSGLAVALGFEAPLFIPNPSEAELLNRQRAGEHGRPWCAGAGTGALALGVQQSAYVFRSIRDLVGEPPNVTFDATLLIEGHANLLIWEAFVSGESKDRSAENPHVDDARRAAVEFRHRSTAGSVASDVHDVEVLSLVGASVLAAGLSEDVGLLTTPCVVVKPPEIREGVGRARLHPAGT